MILPANDTLHVEDSTIHVLSVSASGDERKSDGGEKSSLVEVEEILSISSLNPDEDGLRDLGTDNPFPMDPDALEEQQLTFRAVIVGCALGAVISASKYVRLCKLRY